jgi:ABC-2 type transport system ATP-binding protein
MTAQTPVTDGALQAIDVSKRSGGPQFMPLDTISMCVRRGEIYSVLGAPGSGKSLLLHIFIGLVKPSAGRVLVEGRDVTNDQAHARRRITYVPKGSPLYGSLSAVSNVRFFTQVDGRARPYRTSDYRNAMRRMGVPERYFDRPARISGGAVSLAIWLAIGWLRDAPILIVDEPTAGLDLYASSDLGECLREFSTRGTAVIVATSDVLLAGAISDRVAILKEGRKQVELSRRELVDRSLPQLYLEYMGRSLAARPVAP